MLLSSIFHRPPHSEDTAAFIGDLTSSGITGTILTHANDPIAYGVSSIGWNARCAFSPAAFVKASSVEDVSKAVQVAALHGIPVQARSGGHSFGGYGLGGQNGALVVDLSNLNEVLYDPQTQLATIGGGALLGRITEELDKHSVTFPHGTCAQVGIGGHATIGGQGILSRLYGLTLDNVRSVTAVLADGSVVQASATENEDLFWGVRGAGASLCIVTSFVVITHPMPAEVTHFFFDYSVGSPEELTKVFLKWQEYIASPEVKDDRLLNSLMTVKKGSILIQGSRIGPLEEYEKSAIHVNIGKDEDPKKYDIEVADWVASAQRWATEAVNHYGSNLPLPQFMKSAVVEEPLSEETVLAWFRYIDENTPSGSSTFFLIDMEGGAIADVPNNATAYAHRNALYNICGYGIHPFLPFPDTVISFLSGCMDTIRKTSRRTKPYGVYPGYIDPLLPVDEWAEAYWGENYARLQEIKTKYDPNQVFRNPQSVQPLST